MTEIHERTAGPFAAFNGRKTLLFLTTAIFAIAAWGASFLLPVLYAGSYLLVLKNPRAGWYLDDQMEVARPDFYHVRSRPMELFFHPANWLDIRIRPAKWKHLAIPRP